MRGEIGIACVEFHGWCWAGVGSRLRGSEGKGPEQLSPLLRNERRN